MAFADAPVRDVEYRDLYGLGMLDAAPSTAGLWTGTIHRFAPLYLKLRGYNTPLLPDGRYDSRYVAAAAQFRARNAVNGAAMTEQQFESHVGTVLAVTLVVTAAGTGYAVYRRRQRQLRRVSAQIAMADLSAYRSRRRYRR